MNEDLERVRKQLDYLVEQGREIEPLNPLWGMVKYLRHEGIKGIPGRARHCPIANYLRRETGLEVGISATGVAVDHVPETTGVPPLVTEFIDNFDREAILELVERPLIKFPPLLNWSQLNKMDLFV